MSAISANLRAVADLIESLDETIPQPYITSSGDGSVSLQWFLQISTNLKGAAAKRDAARAIIKAVGGKWDKLAYGDDTLMRFKQGREGVSLTVTVEREAVCNRRVVGTKKVTIPAKPAEKARTVEVDVVEWDCEPVLAEVAS